MENGVGRPTCFASGHVTDDKAIRHDMHGSDNQKSSNLRLNDLCNRPILKCN
jgi:hypothetical protein